MKEEEVTEKEEMLAEDEEIVTEEVVEEVEYKIRKHCLAGAARGGRCGDSRCLPPRPPGRVAARRPPYPTPAAGPRPEPAAPGHPAGQPVIDQLIREPGNWFGHGEEASGAAEMDVSPFGGLEGLKVGCSLRPL